MKKFNLIIFLILFSSVTAFAHSSVDSIGLGWFKGKKVILHKVDPQETFYSIARRYNVHPKSLIIFNDQIHGLKIGDTVRVIVDSLNTFKNVVLVPASDQPAVEQKNPATVAPPAEKIPIKTPKTYSPGSTIHVVAPKETLFSISRKYKVTVAALRKLNNITDNHIEIGQQLLIVDSGKSMLKTTPAKQQNPFNPPKTEKKQEDKEVYTNKPSVFKTPDQASKELNKAKEVIKPKFVREVRENGIATYMNNTNLNQAKSLALHKTAPPGTIVKVTNPTTHRSIMVKVVGPFPDNENTDNALIVISEAAAKLLGVNNSRFRANLSYTVRD